MRKKILILFWLIYITYPSRSQELVLIDSIVSTGNSITDLAITNSGRRIYAITTNNNFISINGNNIQLTSKPGSKYTHLISIQNPDVVDFKGIGGRRLLLTDSSYLVFVSDQDADTLFFKDTILIRPTTLNGYHFGIAEYNFDNKLQRARNWTSESEHETFINVQTLLFNKNKIFISGTYFNVSLTEPFKIDNHLLHFGRYSSDNFIGKIDYETLNFDWLTGDTSELNAHKTSIVVNDDHDLLQVSTDQSRKVHYCNDSLEMMDLYPSNALQYTYFVPRDSSGICGEGFAPEVDYADVSAFSLSSSADNSFLITCFYGSRFFKLGDLILYDSIISSNTALVKVSKDFNDYKLFQCTGSPGDKYMIAEAYGADNEIWVAVMSQTDTLKISSQTFIKETGQQFHSVIAKLDKTLNLISIVHHGHFNIVNFKIGLDNKLYILTRDIGSQLYRLYQVVEPTSIQNIHPKDFEISIFPNPVVGGEIHYKMGSSSTQEIKSLKIYDSLGRLKLNQIIDSTTGILDCKNYSHGIYIFVFENKNGISASKKVVIAR